MEDETSHDPRFDQLVEIGICQDSVLRCLSQPEYFSKQLIKDIIIMVKIYSRYRTGADNVQHNCVHNEMKE